MERGRPKTFDEQVALEQALQVFWEKGYQAASLSDLTQAMGINKPSLYASFGNKEQLYLKTLQRYNEQQVAKHARSLQAETRLLPALRGFLRSVATMLSTETLPGGCMVVNGVVIDGNDTLPAAIRDALIYTVEHQAIGRIKARLQQETTQGKLSEKKTIDTLADYVTTLMAGMAVLSKTGADQQRLFAIIDVGLSVFEE